MHVWILLSATIQPARAKASESEILRLKLRMLPGEDQRWRNSARVERLGNRGELDRFGTSADNDNDVVGQLSP
jgi:hypothetical protein